MLRLPEPRTLRLMICAAVAAGVTGVGGASIVHAGSGRTVKSGTSGATGSSGGAVIKGGSPTSLGGASRAGGGVTITSYGHSAVLVQGGGKRVLLNPFKAVGCAAGLAEPRLQADVILANSRLLDEGAPVASGRFLSKPGSYRVGGIQFEGIANAHDRVGGKRFGQATIWRWQQGGLEIAHLGSTAGPLSSSDQVLLGRPDVLIIGVGGGAKVYSGQEAAEIVRLLQPRRVIPVQTLSGRQPAECDLTSVEPFLQAMAGTPVQRAGGSITLTPPLGEKTTITVLR